MTHFVAWALTALAGIGDPQIATDHPWYGGELTASTFERLFATQAELYERVTQRKVATDEDKALAAWLWRNTHYWHGEPGAENLWGQGFEAGPDRTPREYWSGLYAHGFGLCGTTHAQWTAEMQALLGHNRGRTVGTAGHNSFEVWLTGGAYRNGKLVLLDHDVSTVLFDRKQEALLSIAEIAQDWKAYAVRDYAGNRACGWLPCGLHPDDGGVYSAFNTVEYFPGYAGPPPMVHLRRGETLTRYPAPGLGQTGKAATYVYWGRNYNTAGIPGPERSHTWVNQPAAMYQSKTGAGYKPGQARFGNAVYLYRPEFMNAGYREGIVDESESHVTFSFQTPYIIGATPPGDGPWDIYKPGGRNGLVITGVSTGLKVSVSVDRGQSWHTSDWPKDSESLDLTDYVKGFRQYWLKFHAGAKQLDHVLPSIRTVCQLNTSLVPQLKPGKNAVAFHAGHRALVSAGPTLAQAQAHVVAGKFDSPTVTLELAAPHSAKATTIYAAAHLRSSNPPQEEIAYQIEYSLDQGKSWHAIVRDWRITRRGVEPADFWSQSFCYGNVALPEPHAGPVQVRFKNNGGKAIARAELHLAYEVPESDACEVTFDFRQGSTAGAKRQTQTLTFRPGDSPQSFDAGADPRVESVTLRPVPR